MSKKTPNSGSINPNLLGAVSKPKKLSAQDYIEGILKGDKVILSRAITLVESQKSEDSELAQQIIEGCLPFSGKSLRIGFTGIPGVGKSSWIESFGKYLITQKKKRLAVLAVDPSSGVSHGSILGDKTRMEELTQDKNAFIRPSPSSGSLGGVARKTRETIILCEAAGYNTIFIETVGVGQSETAVKEMVDIFILLLIAGAGDELQGIKRGIMEMADVVLINKSDGDNIKKARNAMLDVKRALHLFPLDERNWMVPVITTSALEKTGLSETYEVLEKYQRHMVSKGLFDKIRSNQNAHWLKNTIEDAVLSRFYAHPDIKKAYSEQLEKVLKGISSPYLAAQILLKKNL